MGRQARFKLIINLLSSLSVCQNMLIIPRARVICLIFKDFFVLFIYGENDNSFAYGLIYSALLVIGLLGHVKSLEQTHLARAGSGIAWIKADIELLNREPENLTALKDAI